MPASAQSFQCQNTTSVIPNVRGEGFAELLGDIVLDCTGGTPTPPNATVPQVNIVVQLDTSVSSKVTATSNNVQFLEALLIVDEPNSTVNPPARPIRNCGAAAEDTTAAGAGVCISTGAGSNGAQFTYDGSGVGHSNVFQGRSLGLVTGQWNQVLFASVPIDPPGTICPAQISQPTCHRIIRITNIRGDAVAYNVGIGGLSAPVTANLIINPVSGLPIDIFSHVIARVQAGLLTPIVTNNSYVTPGTAPPALGGKFDFIQCSDLNGQSQALALTFREGFFDSFKPRNLKQVLDNGVAVPSYAYSGVTPGSSCNPTPVASCYTPVTSNVIGNSAALLNQNVPGTTYSTESGFMNPSAAASGNPPANPLTAGAGTGNQFVETTVITGGTGITAAGRATQGTRLIATFTNVPNGTDIQVPAVVFLYNVISPATITGVAVLVNGTDSAGANGVTTALASVTAGPVNFLGNTIPIVTVAGTLVPGAIFAPAGRAVYEVLFSNPGALEQMVIPMRVLDTCNLGTLTTPCPNLAANLPTPNSVAKVTGGFAPFYAPSSAQPGVRTVLPEGATPTAVPPSGPVPRFINLNAPLDLFSVVRCSCNLLFPFVTNSATAGGNFDTGMAIANTSLDPGNLPPTTYGFQAAAQNGPVQMWYYNRNGATPAEPNFLGQGNTQCTNSTTPGKCDPATNTGVPAGGMLTYVLSGGGYIAPNSPGTLGPQVLLGAPAFQGYIIAQAGFQYCHGFAFISRQGSGFQADNMAMGYLAIVLDAPRLPRTFSTGENDAH
ncbi:MAG TPA: hypothetical protein VLN48_05145 [Bryobacteraceae bacterium]|nr:hypothetical protein [Bryobacteraceae bacterium]